jgi:hypothetical protein
VLRLHPIWRGSLIGLAFASGSAASCAASESTPEDAGTVYELRLKHESETEGSDQSSSSSSGNDAVIERVLEVTSEGVVLEYDLVNEDGLPHGRQDQWEFPFRVFKPLDGPMRLLNAAELETRIEQWLEHTETPRSACGTWYFTWNAFRVECDPQSVLEAVARFDMRPGNLRDGALFEEPGASEPAQIRERSAGPDGATFVVELAVDPAWVRRAEAESDVVVGEIMREPVTFDDALRTRSTEEISGTITITFETDADGGVRRRTKVTKLEVQDAEGVVETRTATETLERHEAESAARPPDAV